MNTFVALSLILGASAFAVPRSSCSFELTASGGESGTIGQLSDGQNRIGGGLSPATFTISNGGIIDSAGRGCILTRKLIPNSTSFIADSFIASVEQFQCDQGVGPTYGFAIDSNETLTYSGSSVFYACPASDTEWNLYTTPVTGQEKCVGISLTASGCGAATSVAPSVTTVTVYDCGIVSPTSPLAASTPVVVQSSTSPAPAVQYSPSTASIPVASPSTSPLGSVPISPSSSEQYSRSTTIVPMPIDTTSVWAHTHVSSAPETIVTYTSSVATPVQSSSTCVTTSLTGSSTSGNYQYPHLIVPISSSSPTTAAGTSYFGTISSNTSTIFNFDIPPSYSGSTCNLIFLLPLLSELETSSYTFSGTGGVDFSQLSSAATEAKTWDNAPSVEKDLGEFTLSEGSSTLVESFVCPAGETLSFEMSAVGDTNLYFFQDWNPSPLGLYITVC
jgi:Ubiquitin 3 binding protein But2 C-terminal domain